MDVQKDSLYRNSLILYLCPFPLWVMVSKQGFEPIGNICSWSLRKAFSDLIPWSDL